MERTDHSPIKEKVVKEIIKKSLRIFVHNELKIFNYLWFFIGL